MEALRIPPGLERNNSPYDTPDRWWDMSQVRFASGSMLPIGGWNRITATALDTPARRFHVWRNNNSVRMSLIGTDNKLYVDDSGVFTDITPAGFSGPSAALPTTGGFGTGLFSAGTFGTPRSSPSPIFSPYGYWSFGNWGQDILFTTNTDGRLWKFIQSTPTTAPTVVSGSPSGIRAALVTAERHAMAIGTSSDPRQIAWSSREDETDWVYASTTNTAGFLNLHSRTPLLYGWNVAEGVLVASYTDMFLVRYIGQPYVYGGTNPIATTSFFNPQGLAVFDDGKAVWLGRTGFQLYSGGFVQALFCPVVNDILNGQDLTKRMDPTWGPLRMHAAANGRYPEVWFFYPSVGSSECNRYIIWNYVENVWYWGVLNRSAAHPADSYQYPYMADPAGHVYEHEIGLLDNGASRVGSVWVESGALSIARGGIEVQQFKLATGANYDVVDVSIIGAYTPQGTEYTEGPFMPRDDGYVDARANYPYMRLRFTNHVDGDFAIGTLFADAAPSGDMR